MAAKCYKKTCAENPAVEKGLAERDEWVGCEAVS